METKDNRMKMVLYLTTGHTIEFFCEEFNFTWNGLSGTYTGYKFTKTDRHIGVVPSHISAYEASKND